MLWKLFDIKHITKVVKEMSENEEKSENIPQVSETGLKII